MTEFQIKKGLSTNLFDADGNCLITLEEGCWYLTIDTVDLYVAILEGQEIVLKKANDLAGSFDALAQDVAMLKSDLASIKSTAATTQYCSTIDELPTVGTPNVVYFIGDKNKACMWNGHNYVWSAPDAPEYTLISGGTATTLTD